MHCSLALREHFFFFSVLSFVFINFFNIFFKKNYFGVNFVHNKNYENCSSCQMNFLRNGIVDSLIEQ
jgi:hypothetical protein